MTEYIEIHKKSLIATDECVLLLQNVDEISAIYKGVDGAAIIALRTMPNVALYGQLEVTETYAKIKQALCKNGSVISATGDTPVCCSACMFSRATDTGICCTCGPAAFHEVSPSFFCANGKRREEAEQE